MLSLYKQTAVHRSFAIADNLGEVSAKAQVDIIEFYYNCNGVRLHFLQFKRHILTVGLSVFRFKQCALTTLAFCLLHC